MNEGTNDYMNIQAEYRSGSLSSCTHLLGNYTSSFTPMSFGFPSCTLGFDFNGLSLSFCLKIFLNFRKAEGNTLATWTWKCRFSNYPALHGISPCHTLAPDGGPTTGKRRRRWPAPSTQPGVLRSGPGKTREACLYRFPAVNTTLYTHTETHTHTGIS